MLGHWRAGALAHGGDSIGLEGIAVPRQQAHQLRMHEEFFLSDGPLLKNAGGGKRFEVSRGSLAAGNLCFHQVGDPAVRLLEDHVDQFPTVDFRQLAADVVGGIGGELSHGSDLGGRPRRRFLDTLEDVDEPFIPGILAGDPSSRR